jgi:bisphosphoglycerate-dependent phosphoglycerate mutase
MKNGESKENVLSRLLPYFQNDVLYTLQKNNVPMIVTHKHCARVLMKYLLNMNDEDFETYTIPNDILELTMNRDFTLKSHKFIDY